MFEMNVCKSLRLQIYKCKVDEITMPGLPDGLFSDQKSNLGAFWRVLYVV
jgi:hypothetical protein